MVVRLSSVGRYRVWRLRPSGVHVNPFARGSLRRPGATAWFGSCATATERSSGHAPDCSGGPRRRPLGRAQPLRSLGLTSRRAATPPFVPGRCAAMAAEYARPSPMAEMVVEPDGRARWPGGCRETCREARSSGASRPPRAATGRHWPLRAGARSPPFARIASQEGRSQQAACTAAAVVKSSDFSPPRPAGRSGAAKLIGWG